MNQVPYNMQTFTVEVNNNSAFKILQNLQEKKLITILAKPDKNSLIFPGEPLTEKEFKNMIAAAENSGSISIKEAKAAWVSQRKKLLKPGIQ